MSLGTAAAAVATAAYFLGFEWQVALLLGAALSPADPAVVFSVLGRREISGRSGTILEGESGACAGWTTTLTRTRSTDPLS